ncbi:hypothetical protein [Paenibacillus sp. FSL R10-2771]
MKGKSAPESAESGQQEEMRGKSTLDFTGGCPEVVCLEWSGVAWVALIYLSCTGSINSINSIIL